MKKLSKKSAALLVAGLVTCGLLAGCGGGDKKDAPKDGGKGAVKVLNFGCQMYSDGLIDPTLQTNTAWNVSRFGIGQTAAGGIRDSQRWQQDLDHQTEKGR